MRYLIEVTLTHTGAEWPEAYRSKTYNLGFLPSDRETAEERLKELEADEALAARLGTEARSVYRIVEAS
jgi:hypothetical protein